eukprot:jgi/Ulvmu1/3674/UM017_0088.1
MMSDRSFKFRILLLYGLFNLPWLSQSVAQVAPGPSAEGPEPAYDTLSPCPGDFGGESMSACESRSTDVDETNATDVFTTTDSTLFSCFQTMWDANMETATGVIITQFDSDTGTCAEFHFPVPIPADALTPCVSQCGTFVMSPEPCIAEMDAGRVTFENNISVWLMPDSLFEGDQAATMQDYSTSDISWADTFHGGCPGSVTFASNNDSRGLPEAVIDTWPITRLSFRSGTHRLSIARSPYVPDFVSGPGRGTTLMIMFQVATLPADGPSFSELITVDGTNGNDTLSDLWMIRLNPEDRSVDCVYGGNVSISTNPGRIELHEWYVLVCGLSEDNHLYLRINRDSAQGNSTGSNTEAGVPVDTVLSRTFQLKGLNVHIGRARGRSIINVAAAVVHDRALSQLEQAIVQERVAQQLDEVYPDMPHACPGETPAAMVHFTTPQKQQTPVVPAATLPELKFFNYCC